MGCFGFFGSFGNVFFFWIVRDLFALFRIFVIVWHGLGYFGSFGIFWHLLGSFRSFWMFFGPFSIVCDLLFALGLLKIFCGRSFGLSRLSVPNDRLVKQQAFGTFSGAFGFSLII